MQGFFDAEKVGKEEKKVAEDNEKDEVDLDDCTAHET